jgi:hypothetical protein
MNIRAPYLIQRAKIETPLAEPDTRLSKAVDMDYMGSSEFEWGALPQSFRRIESKADAWICRLVPEITEDDVPLRVWSALTDEEFEIYKGYLETMRKPISREPGLYTKESVHFNVDYKPFSQHSVTNFWWDLDNDVMFGFKKEFMKRVGNYVASSLKYMNEQKGK